MHCLNFGISVGDWQVEGRADDAHLSGGQDGERVVEAEERGTGQLVAEGPSFLASSSIQFEA